MADTQEPMYTCVDMYTSQEGGEDEELVMGNVVPEGEGGGGWFCT
jgi:hypothetical protein